MTNQFDEDTPSIIIDSLAVTMANRNAQNRSERKNAILTYVNNTDLNTLSVGSTSAYGARIH